MKPKNVFLFLATFLLATSVYAGREGGGGDNLSPGANSAWFLGANKTVSYCMDVSDNFGVEREQLTSTIAQTFAQWKTYIDKRLKDAKQATTLVYIGPCNGKLPTDLGFFFRTSNDYVTKAKRAYDNPSAFAKQVNWDIKTGWGKGFVWLADLYSIAPKKKFPDWTDKDKLYGMLLHEAGHILGSQHKSGTIMYHAISDFIGDLSNYSDFRTNLRKIDWDNELAPCFMCSYVGHIRGIHYPNRVNDKTQTQQLGTKVFRELVGRDSVGNVTVALVNSISKGGFPAGQLVTTYVIGDSRGKYSFDVESTWGQWSSDESYELEQVWLEKFDPSLPSEQPKAGGVVNHVILDYGSVLTKTGQKRAVILQRNMSQVNLAIDMEIDGEIRNIFTADPHR